MSNLFLENSQKHFLNYKSMAEKAIAQLEPQQLFISPEENSNSIAIIIQHMAGNLISRFTDFLTTDGEKPWRAREAEFEPNVQDSEVLMMLWNNGWDTLFGTLQQLSEDDLQKTIYIRKEPLIALDAIIRQLMHHASHVGQIIYIAKMLKSEEWQTLSIPKKNN